MSDYVQAWRTIVDADDQTAAVAEHLRFLVQEPASAAWLDDVMGHFLRATLGDDVLQLTFRRDDDEYVVRCRPPYLGPIDGAPKSVAAVARVHNGMAWPSRGGGWYGYDGFDEGGRWGGGGWEWDALLDAEEENEEFLAGLAEAGYGPVDALGAMDFGQNWLIWNPAQRNVLDEPVLFFVSHGDCEAVAVSKARDLPFGSLMLGVMAQRIAGRKIFDEPYS